MFIKRRIIRRKDKEKMKFLKVLVFLCGLLLFATQAHAVPVTLDPSMDNSPFDWEAIGNETANPDILAAIKEFISPIDPEKFLYKSNVGNKDYPDPKEEGPLAGSYETAFGNEPLDPADAIIKYVGGDIVGSTAWLLVKDGHAEPNWYLYNLTDLGWTGMELIELKNFFLDKDPETKGNQGGGAISYVALYGSSVPVPEPATMLLLGFGIIGLAAFGRKRFF
jgi:hypothetical protein